MKNKSAKQSKSKRKGSENAFGCDLNEHLQNSGQEVPQVLKACAEFIEKHGVVDGIYRLSGITSNIQRLRQEFSADLCPDLTKEVYLQDIHCVGSLCKLYFRELPNPLLTYELYKKFTDALSIKEEHEQLQNIQSVIKELPSSHFRTLEYLAKHLAHLATLSHRTNMHTRNLALVWAPNLLRSKEIEVSSCNGDEAFLEVRVQQSVVEFILNHTEQLFNHGAEMPKPKEGPGLVCGGKYATLPPTSQCGPMKLMSLEEAQARTLSPNHPARRERQRENSLPDTSTAAMYHTVIELTDNNILNRRKFSGKSKKWKSIFSLGRSVTDARGKLSRNGSVFMRAQNASEKKGIRPSKSMDSLCSQPTDDDKATSPGGANGFVVPALKSRTLGSDINYDPSEQDSNWEFDLRKASDVVGSSPGAKRRGASSASSSSLSSSSSSPLQRALPEQLKVFKGDDLGTCQPTSPKNRRMLYSGSSHNGSSRPSFPGSLFPLESSPRHQRKALNISEPFAVSVPLRVSAVISSNSTPCRAPGKERERERERSFGALLRPREAGPPEPQRSESLGSIGFRELVPVAGFRDGDSALGGNASVGHREYPHGDSSGGSGCSIYSNSSSIPTEKEENQRVGSAAGDVPPERVAEGQEAEVKELLASVEVSVDLTPSQPKAKETLEEMPQSSGRELDTTLIQHNEAKALEQLDTKSVGPELWAEPHRQLKIAESETNVLDDQLKSSSSMTRITGHDGTLNLNSQAKRRSSLPTHPVSSKGHFQEVTRSVAMDEGRAAVLKPTLDTWPNGQPENSSGWTFLSSPAFKGNPKSLVSLEALDVMANKLQFSPFLLLKETDILQDAEPWPSVSPAEDCVHSVEKTENIITVASSSASIACIEPCNKNLALSTDKTQLLLKEDSYEKAKEKTKSSSIDLAAKVKGSMEQLSKCLDERRLTIEISHQEEEDIWGSHLAGLDQVEPWEDLSTAKLWVTSPLHSPKLEDLFPPLKSSVPAVSSGTDKKVVDKEPTVLNVTMASQENTAKTREAEREPISPAAKNRKAELDELGLSKISELFVGATFEGTGDKTESKHEAASPAVLKSGIHQEETVRMPKKNLPKQRASITSQRFHRQVSHEPCIVERNEENITPKHRPYSLNLDLGYRCIRDISNQQNVDFVNPFTSQRGSVTPGAKHDGLSLELEMFLRDRQAPMRRNSEPVSVSSVRTAFMIKTCQAKAVPVVPPKLQYSHIPDPVLEKRSCDPEKRNGSEQEADKIKVEKADSLPPLQVVKDAKEERENCEPLPRPLRLPSMERPAEPCKSAPVPEFPVLRRKRSANGDSFMDCPRPERSTLLQRSSFRNRPRPQSLILFSPPFPIMDYHPAGDDGKLVLSPIKSPTETSPLDVFSKEIAESLKTPEGVTLRNKMTLPKSGQRLETSTSCFYQPQRRSMIFDSRSNRQIE